VRRGTVASLAAALLVAASLGFAGGLATPTSAQEAPEGSSDCSVMIGMSQVRNTFHGAYDSLGADEQASFKERWFLHWYPGQVLGGWASPANAGWTDPRFDLGDGIRVGLDDTCQTPTHASFGFDPATGPSLTMHGALDLVVDNIRSFYPTVETIDVWLLVGDENHGSCLLGSNLVRAADLHRNGYSEWQEYVGPIGVGLGPDLHVPCPSGWRDSKGHLSGSGALIAGSNWLAFQESLDVEPTTTTVTFDTTTTFGDTTTTTTSEATTTTTLEVTTTTACAP
jgi:hypothetical protein